jgi:aminomuconate-semialdehyde/2-hydroxymuconate-6-semialdehyde dehydrogenase
MTLTAVARANVVDVAVAVDHLIDGNRVPSADGARFADHSPIDGAHLADLAAGGPADVDAAVAAARSAFPGWSALGASGRREILTRLAALVRERTDDLARVETEDNGSLLLGNSKNVINRGAHNLEFFADFALSLAHPVIEGPVCDNHVRYDPAGVAALVTPWNAPFMLSTWRVAPALAAGNTVVLKPPEWAPLTCSLLGDLALEAGVPPGVLNVVQGIGEQAGAALVAHPGVDRVGFTGSPVTGREIAAAAAANLTPCSFELGGKSPFVVCDDADLDRAAKEVAGQYVNAGQVCLAGTRVLVEASIADDFLERVRAAVDRLPVGDPRDLATRIGPLIHREHFERVSGFVQRALAEGAQPLLGGGPHERGGLFFAPTLLTDVAPDAEVVQREVFGPVLTWQVFSSDDEVIDLANATEYGLAATVFTGDEARAARIAERVRAGTVWVNCFFVRDLAAPFGGRGISGIGREGGEWSFDFFCDVKNVAVRRGSFVTPASEGFGDG